jgi:hypothetical protein
MADYYPLLAKALANLPSRGAPTARRAIYERARKALIGQLRSIQPPVPETDIANEDAALDQAIARLEAEYSAQTVAAAPPAPAAPAAPPTTPAAPRPNPSAPSRANPVANPAARPAASATPAAPSAPVARPAAPAPARPAAAPPAAPRPNPTVAPPARPVAAPAAGAKPTVAPPPPRPPVAPPRPMTPPSPTIAAAVDVAPSHADSAASTLAVPPIAVQRGAVAEDRGHAPPVAPSPRAAHSAPPPRPNGDIARPVAPGRTPEIQRRRWPLVVLAAIAILVGAVAVAAYLYREKPRDSTAAAPIVTTDTASEANQANQGNPNKIAERVKAPGQVDPTPAAAETPIPTVKVAPVPVPVGPAPAASAPTAPAASADNPQTAAADTPPAPSDPQKPAVTLGNAIWSVLPAAPGQPSTVAIRVDVDIPDQKMHATMTIRKNADASLPATHTIDLRTTFADGAEIKGIKDMGLPQLRKDDAATGDAVSGVRVKINDSYYLVGLTRSDADAARNLDLLATRPWFDFPLLLNDDRIAKLTFSKGDTGDRAMAQALDAWK